MTGFGRAEHATNKIAARVEASSVNRKQGEIVVQLPRAYQELEAEIRKSALNKLSRGRVSISIQLELPEGIGGLEESKELDIVIENTLIKNNIPFYKIKVDDDTVDNIIKLVNID